MSNGYRKAKGSAGMVGMVMSPIPPPLLQAHTGRQACVGREGKAYMAWGRRIINRSKIQYTQPTQQSFPKFHKHWEGNENVVQNAHQMLTAQELWKVHTMVYYMVWKRMKCQYKKYIGI